MNTIIKINGFEIEVSGGLNDAFVKVTNNAGEVIADLDFDQEMPALKKDEVEHVYIKMAPADEGMDEWQQSYRKIQNNVKHLENVCYSAYESDKNGIPKDNLSEVALQGEVKVMWDYAWVSEEGVKFQPKVLVNPTWLDLAVVADEAIRTTGDENHNFFEGVRWDKVQVGYQLLMGS